MDRYTDKFIDKINQTDTQPEPDRPTSVGPCHSWYSPVPEGTHSDCLDMLQPPHEVVSLPSQSYAQDLESVASCGPIHGWRSEGGRWRGRWRGEVEGKVEGGGGGEGGGGRWRGRWREGGGEVEGRGGGGGWRGKVEGSGGGVEGEWRGRVEGEGKVEGEVEGKVEGYCFTHYKIHV